MKNKNIIVESLAVAAAATGLASEYLFKKAFARVDYVPETSDAKQKYATKYWECVDWFKKRPKEHWTFGIPGETEQMSAYYLPATTESQQVVIISHGYKGNGETMANYARMFSQMGFNVLLPDDRGHGESAGKYISFGWLDRLDYLKWIQKINARIGVNAQILLFGVSMGAATVAMLTGESLPPQVKCTIADCGYSSIDEELTYLLKQQFHLPRYPFYPLVSTINHHRLGYYLHSVSTTAQLKKNTKPIFFIHGEKDAYVPVKMAYENYYATSAPKELWIVKDATHAESFWKDPESYQRHLNKFLERYYYENPKMGWKAMKIEGHTHTELCPHGSQEKTEEMIQRAIALGFEKYCITEHAPLPVGFKQVYQGSAAGIDEASLAWNQLDEYFKLGEYLQQKYGDVLEISVGFEVDYIPGFEKQIRAFLDEYGPRTQQNILSVHFMRGKDNDFWCLDLAASEFEQGFDAWLSQPQELYRRYFTEVRESVEADLGKYRPQRIGHMSLIKKYQDYFGFPEDFDEKTLRIVRQILTSIKRQERQLDLNTAGLYKPDCNEFYPGAQICRLAREQEIPLIYGSDAHAVSEVGRGYHLKNALVGLDKQ